MKKNWILIASLGFIFACSSSDSENQSVDQNANTNQTQTVKKEPETVEDYIAVIKADLKWMEIIKEKAEKRGISIDEMIRIDAEWTYNEKIKKTPEYQIEEIKNKIKADAAWMSEIEKKAEKTQTPVDVVLSNDAEFIYNKRLKESLK